jgi:hypothetical protein
MEVQTTTMLIILFAGIIFTTFMFVYRKVSEGQTFDMERYAKTLGYVAILALGSYVATGLVPDFAAILAQLEQGIPNAQEILALATAVLFGVVNFFLKKTAPPVPAQVAKPSFVPMAEPAPVIPTSSRPGFTLTRDGKIIIQGADGWGARINADPIMANIPDDKNYQIVSPTGRIFQADKETAIFLVSSPEAASWRARNV